MTFKIDISIYLYLSASVVREFYPINTTPLKDLGGEQCNDTRMIKGGIWLVVL